MVILAYYSEQEHPTYLAVPNWEEAARIASRPTPGKGSLQCLVWLQGHPELSDQNP
jgi:hypothetical protein